MKTTKGPMTDIQSIGAMLSYRRPASSRTEKKFIRDHILPLGMNIDKMGNLYKKVGDSPVLWSSHTDTVHRTGGKQKLLLSEGKYKVFDTSSNCLGADDTAGVWIMTQMIEANVPGLYVFHRGEEIGGKGSKYIALHNKKILEGIHFAVAFDRYGKTSIITHQAWDRCCSDTFAESLGKELGMGHKGDDGGTFTDTANYTDLIAECTNLSVGYQSQHCATETLDVKYLCELRDAMFDFNYKNLTESRKPGEKERKKWTPREYYGEGWWGDFWDDQQPRSSGGVLSTYERLVTLIKDNPREIADWIEECGSDFDEVRYAVWQRGGIVRPALGYRHISSHGSPTYKKPEELCGCGDQKGSCESCQTPNKKSNKIVALVKPDDKPPIIDPAELVRLNEAKNSEEKT